MPKLVIMRFLLPRQVTLAAWRRKKFSLGREQMRSPQPLLWGEREEKIRMRNIFTETVYSRKPENGKDDVVNHIVCLRNHNDTLPEPD